VNSQSNRIARHLLAGKTLTPLGALRLFDCFRLGARIYDLRRAGMPIESATVKRKGKRFARYYIESARLKKLKGVKT